MPHTYLTAFELRNYPITDGDHHIGSLESITEGYDILSNGMYVGACFSEHGTDADRIELRLNQFGLRHLDEIIIAARRTVHNSGVLTISGNHVDEYTDDFQAAGMELVDNVWRVAIIPPGTCVWCNTRPASETYAESVMDYVHGNQDEVCEHCVLVRQIEYAEEQAARLPELRERFAQLEDGVSVDG